MYAKVSLLALPLLACQAKDTSRAAPAASSAQSAPAPAPGAIDYSVEANGSTTLDMPGKDEHIKASTSRADGALHIDATDLSKTQGEIRVDLTSLTTHTFGEASKDDAQTEHARTWLEAVVDGKIQESHRYAVFVVRRVDVPGERALDKIPLSPAPFVRLVKAVVHGALTVHGHQVERSVPVDLEFAYPAATAAADRPSALHIRTSEPLRVTLKEHDIKPRDPLGKVLSWTSQLTGKVATDALVSVDLLAKPTIFAADAGAGRN